MPERAEPILRVLCALLAVVFVLEIARVVVRHNPVGKLSVPQLPTLATKTNATAETKTTNGEVAKVGTKGGTNGVGEKAIGTNGTNLISQKGQKPDDTNVSVIGATNKIGPNTVSNAVVDADKKATNTVASLEEKRGSNKLSASDFGSMKTNGATATIATPNKTNNLVQTADNKGTNPATGKPARGNRSFAFMPGQMGGEKLPDLPPVIQARIDKVVVSEILAQLTKPQPAGLLGIAGHGAILRSSSGQTGYVKEGSELGGMKLLQVGVNRVLVVEDGKTNELTIFSGIGGETLLPKQGETNNETITKVQTPTQ